MVEIDCWSPDKFSLEPCHFYQRTDLFPSEQFALRTIFLATIEGFRILWFIFVTLQMEYNTYSAFQSICLQTFKTFSISSQHSCQESQK